MGKCPKHNATINDTHEKTTTINQFWTHLPLVFPHTLEAFRGQTSAPRGDPVPSAAREVRGREGQRPQLDAKQLPAASFFLGPCSDPREVTNFEVFRIREPFFWDPFLDPFLG